jgi:Family of unknown function (DUF6294)
MKFLPLILVVAALALALPSAGHSAAAVESKTFTWSDTFRAGDCGSDTVSVVLRSDGTGHLSSVSWTWTTHSGDYWWWAIEGLDQQKVQLWNLPFHKGPRMDDGHPPPRYHNDFDFNFDPSKYAGTAYLRLASKC